MIVWCERRRDWRARQIDDPVARLRYLRHTAVGEPPRARHLCGLAAISLCLLIPARASRQAQSLPPGPAVAVQAFAPLVRPTVWLVQTTNTEELYSNGLRISTEFTVSYHPRSYLLYRAESSDRSQKPAGILFHSTESHVAPFEAEHNRVLQRVGRSLVAYVRDHRAYHYVVDRFGRVYRIVEDGCSADHAGNSVWSWEGRACLNLNHAFLGVAFEGRTDDPLSAAQIRSGSVLVEMLRARYSILAANCLTHAQVSLNPANMRVGWHTDWARNFPFAALGLPDNYQLPVAAVAEFGFGFDPGYLDAAGEGLWIGLHRAELLQKAGPASRAELQRRFAHLREKESL